MTDSGPDRFFAPGNRVAEALPGYEHRPQQQAMAKAVWQALSTSTNLAVEAGTGVGKSLAYLVPAAVWAARTRQRVAVSTYTRVLQSQLTGQDIPLLRRIVAETPATAVAFGQENYLCRFRLQTRVARGLFDTQEEARTADLLLSWAGKSEYGILLEVPFALPARLRLRVSRDSAACRRKDCPFFKDCCYYKARRSWDKSGLLVVNHALFFAACRPDSDLLPEIKAVVFDEAHRLEDACVLHFSARVSRLRLFGVLDSLSPTTGRGLVAALGIGSGLQEALDQEVLACRTELQDFFDRVEVLLPSGAVRLRLVRPLENTPEVRLNRLSNCLKEVSEDADDEQLTAELSAACLRLAEAAAGLRRFAEPDTDARVQWVERSGPQALNLISAPLDVAPVLKEQVYPNYSSVILTSATLTVASRFDFLASRVGLDRFEFLLLDSPFDYARNSLLYVNRDLPEPNRPDFNRRAAKVIARILEASQGRALVLFTSYDTMNRVLGMMPALPHPVISQGELPAAQLLDRFRTDTHSVLFATQSFWQGVDVPGESLSCLVICRLPFEVPDDPRLSAIAEQLRVRGQQPFSTYQLPTAILRFRQGFGRLIRTSEDRGVVCVLDPRILTRTYGRFFVESLPPGLPLTTELDLATRFFTRRIRS